MFSFLKWGDFLEGKIVMGFSGIGKTHISNGKSTFIDLESSKFKYKLTERDEDLERTKGDRNRVLSKGDWHQDYIEAIEENLKKYDYVLIWISLETLEELLARGHKVTVIIPENEQLVKDEYVDRYRKRGNTNQFIEDMLGFWSKILVPFLNYVEGLDGNSVKVIKLKSGEYLKDAIKKM